MPLKLVPEKLKTTLELPKRAVGIAVAALVVSLIALLVVMVKSHGA